MDLRVSSWWAVFLFLCVAKGQERQTQGLGIPNDILRKGNSPEGIDELLPLWNHVSRGPSGNIANSAVAASTSSDGYLLEDSVLQTYLDDFDSGHITEECADDLPEEDGQPNMVLQERATLCRKNALHQNDVTNEALKQRVGREILAKLGLKEPPKIRPDKLKELKKLSSVVFEDAMRHDTRPWVGLEQSNSDEANSYYKQTKQFLMFSQPGTDCHPPCNEFHLPKDALTWTVEGADLWFHRNSARGRIPPTHHTFTVIERHAAVNHTAVWSQNAHTRREEEWIKLPVSALVRSWIRKAYESQHSLTLPLVKQLSIKCSTCAISTSGQQRPFIRVKIGEQQVRRNRRNTDCSAIAPGSSMCCREELRVNFADLDFFFILEPDSYQAFHCRGPCEGLEHESTINAQFRQTLTKQNRTAFSHLLPCCVPTQMSSFSILFAKDDGSDYNMEVATLPNMVVDSCGCR